MKTAFVDGAAFRFMCRDFGIERVDYRQLFSILSEIGSEHNLAAPPLYTLGRRHAKLTSVLRREGFEPFLYAEGSQADDQEIIRRIEALGPEVSEIILVGADADFVPALEKKARRGVNVYWAGTRNGTRTGHVLELRLATLFQFIELQEYAARLRFQKRARPKVPPLAGYSGVH